MKEPWEWTEEDLLSLIANKEQESLTLEYKACDALKKTDPSKNEISKDVSAMANSAGGTIVYGITEKDNYPETIDIGYDPKEITKEWLEQVISNRIQRKIEGVRIKAVELTSICPGRVAYVVYIPQSLRAPHQANDKKFYKRYNFESKAMEEYEIRDVSNRSKGPDLDIDMYCKTDIKKIYIDMYIKNNSENPSEYGIVEFCIDNKLDYIYSEVQHFTKNVDIASRERIITLKNKNIKMKAFRWSHVKHKNMPIFKGVTMLFFDINFSFPEKGEYYFIFEIMTHNMKIKRIDYTLTVLDDDKISLNKEQNSIDEF